MKRLFLAAAFALTATAAHAACNPSDAPPNSVGCQPALPSAVQATDLFLGWRPSLGKTASRTITPAQLLQAGLPGGFSSLSASGSATVLGTLTVGDTTPLTGGSKFFRFGYGATNPLVTMQSAGTDSTGAAQQVLSISQQVTHTGAGGAGAIGALYSASTIDGAPYQDYYAAAFTMTNRALRLGGATPDQAQHGTLFTHQVKALPTAGFNPGDVMADSWVQWWVMQDRTNLPSSQGGALVGVEFDIFGNNQDDAPTKKRFARQVVLNNYASDAAHPLEWGYGDYWNSFTGGAQDTFFNVVSAYYAGWTVAAIDLSQGTGSRANPYVDATNRGVDIKMRDGGKLGFNGDGATGSYMTHGTSRFQYWAGGSERASISDTGVGIIGGGTAPFTLSNGTLSVPSSQNMAIQLASAGTSISLGATSAGLGNVLTITPNSNGNSFFGSVPNDVTIPNRLTVGQLRSSGGTFALSGTVTPTAFSGTGATATVTFAAISGVVIPVGSSVTISGATPAGYNGTYTVTASTNTTVSFASSTTGALSVAGSMAYAMQSQRIVNMTSSWSGTPAAGTAFFPYTFTITSDTADTQGTNSGAPIMYLAHNWGGAAKGSKGGLRIGLIQTSATNDPPVGLVNQQHVVGEWWGATGYNTGGTGSGTLAAGSFYGTNPQILLQPGATYWRLANAMGEVNLAVYASSRTLTVGGTVTAGDVLTVTFASADIVGTPVSVSWTVGASQTTGMIANNIAAAIWSNAALSNAKISASVSGSVVTIYWFTHIAALTTTVSTSGGATETLTLGSPVGGASADIKLMGSLVRLADDTAPATKNSAFFLFTSQPGGGTAGLFDYGLVFGTTPNYGGEWSWHKGSTLIEAGVATTYGGSGQTHPIIPNWAKYGLDFSKVGFSGNGGASIRVPGFQIASDTTGAVFIGGYKIAATSAGLLFDTTTGGTASAVALNSGGGGGAGVATGNYVVGDLGHDAYGGQYEVATVNASTGAVATFTVRVYPSFTSGAAPANPIAVTGGSGSGWTVNATWPSAPRVQFQASGGNTLVGTGSAIATNATSGFLQLPTMAGAPTGVVGAAGQAAVVIDTTNNKICWSTGGGTWKCALGS